MEWVSVKDSLPLQSKLKGKRILILVNGVVFTCDVLDLDVFLVLTHDLFVYSNSRGFYGDERFAKPTHWLEIPELPKSE